MTLQQAQKLQPGQRVTCPPDRGGEGYDGKVVSVGPETCKTWNGIDFLWVVVETPYQDRHKTVWPSTRLS